MAPVVAEPKKRGRKPKSAASAVAVETEAAVSVPVVEAAPVASSSSVTPAAEAAPKKKGRKPKVQNE